MIEAAEKDGTLLPGQRILEPSSGNTGIALAAIAQIKGYPITILMPTSVSIERRQMLQIFGADIILTPGEGRSPKASDTVKVNYRGTLLDGTEFDSSYKRNEPIEFPLSGVIRGWTEGLRDNQPQQGGHLGEVAQHHV